MWGLKRIIFVVRLIAVNDTLFDGSIVGMQASQACSGIFHYSGGKMVRCSVLMYTGKKEGGGGREVGVCSAAGVSQKVC